MPVEFCRIGSVKDRLGEGPVWDVADHALYWVDAIGRAIHRYFPASGVIDHWQVPGVIGSLALRKGGGAILALEDGFHLFDFATGRTELLHSLNEGGHTRFNDGKVDRDGNFVAGTMTRTRDERGLGAMYRIDAAQRVTKLVDDIVVFNGPCFSPDGKTLYYADSIRQMIWACDYNSIGEIENRRRFADISVLDALPDGATVDSDGCVWSALVSIGTLVRFSPSGELMETIHTPIRYPTSIMFGGADLNRLYVTSISDSLRFQAPGESEDGGLFEICGLGARGIPESRFAG